MATTDFGFDFRSTAIFVTDPSGCSAVLSSNAFPHTFTATGTGATISAGWVVAGSAANRLASNDPRLAGIEFTSNSAGTTIDFRVTLPSTGVWIIALAMGDASNAQSQYLQFQDNAVNFGSTLTAVATGANSFMDANGSVWTEANWLTSNTTLTHTFVSTQFDVIVGWTGSSGNSSTISHLRVTAGAAATGVPGLKIPTAGPSWAI